MTLRILRLARTCSGVTADVFERNFAAAMVSGVAVLGESGGPWMSRIFGTARQSKSMADTVQAFDRATRGFHFFCPSWEWVPLIPLLVQLRNRARSKTRLLMIAHSPGGYVQEWLQLRATLVPGDLIVAPSQSAKEIIEWVCPQLREFIQVIPHPIPKLAEPEERRSVKGKTLRLLSLSRITPDKLIHRQIDAVAQIRDGGGVVPQLDIAGPLNYPGSDCRHPYARSLAARIDRLGLQSKVRLLGVVTDDREKARLIAGADALINLSITIEESFGKSVAEALGLGVPVVTTRWDGLPETVGECGPLIPVEVDAGKQLDVCPSKIADAINRVGSYSAGACRDQARRFSLGRVGSRYARALDGCRRQINDSQCYPDGFASVEVPAAPLGSALRQSTPLTCFSIADLYSLQWRHRRSMINGVRGSQLVAQEESWVRSLILNAAKMPLSLLMAGKASPLEPDTQVKGDRQHLPTENSGSLKQRAVRSLALPGDSSSKLACVQFLRLVEDFQASWFSLDQLDTFPNSPGKGFVRVDLLCLAKRYEEAWGCSLSQLDRKNLGVGDFLRIRQLGRLCRHWGKPERALGWMGSWLERYPDEPGSGSLWLEYVLTCLAAEKMDLAACALNRARQLLGGSPVLQKVESQLMNALARQNFHSDSIASG